MYQGRCYAKIGDFDEALLRYDVLLANPNQPDAFLQLKKKVLTLAVDCWMAEGRNQHIKAITEITVVLSAVTRFQQKEPEWLYLRLVLAKAYKAQFDEWDKKKNPSDVKKKLAKQALEEARKLAIFVGEHPSEYRRAAQELRRLLFNEKPADAR